MQLFSAGLSTSKALCFFFKGICYSMRNINSVNTLRWATESRTEILCHFMSISKSFYGLALRAVSSEVSCWGRGVVGLEGRIIPGLHLW